MSQNPLAIGVDIVEIGRIRRLSERYGARFRERVFTGEELKRANARRDPAVFLAGRFAAKEAVLKVLGTGLTAGMTWKDIAVHEEASGAPRAMLSGRVAEEAARLGVTAVLVSIAHDGDYAVANAVGVGSGS